MSANLYTAEIDQLREKNEGLTAVNKELAKFLTSALAGISLDLEVCVGMDRDFHKSDGYRDAIKFIADAREALARAGEGS